MKLYQKFVAFVASLGFGSMAFALPVDLTALTDAVDLTTVIAALLAVGALLMAPAVAKYAVSAVRRMFPG